MNKLRVLLPAAAVVAASVGGACAWVALHGDRAVAVTPPAVNAGAAAQCRTLHGHLPATVDGQSRVATSPASELTAAWGASPIVLTCGAPEPSILTPGTKDYDPSVEAYYVNGVAWLPVQQSGGYAFYATQRAVLVEVFVPSSYNLSPSGPGMDAPTDLSAAVIAGTETENLTSGPDVDPAATIAPSAGAS